MNKTIRSIIVGAALAGVVAPVAAEAATQRGQRGQRVTRTTRQARAPRAPARTRQAQQQQMALGRSRATRPMLALEVEAYSEMMTQSILGFATPPFQLLPKTSNIRLNQTRQGNYKQNITPRYDVSGLDADGAISFTALLPVSGHVDTPKDMNNPVPNPVNADNYAKTNVYDVSVQYADGSRESFVVKSTGYVTPHDLELKLKPGTNFVRFAPRGSGGVGGFQSGREIELNWTGN